MHKPTDQSVLVQNMKETFFNLNKDKQNRIILAALEEFALSGYENTSLDNIIRRAGISKGGLYEYIDSKEDLFQYGLEYAYGGMYSYILSRIEAESNLLPSDPLERTRVISSIAVDFYLASPVVISFIVKSSQVSRVEIRERVQGVFDSYFLKLYASADYAGIGYEGDRILALLKWLLIKTRNDFQENMKSTGRSALCRDAYLEEWKFFLSVLSRGIYEGGAVPPEFK